MYTLIRPEVMKQFSCLTQLNTKFFLLINVKMPSVVVAFSHLRAGNIAFYAYLSLINAQYLDIFILRAFTISCSAELSITFSNFGASLIWVFTLFGIQHLKNYAKYCETKNKDCFSWITK